MIEIKQNYILRHLTSNKRISIRACDGSKTIADSKGIFKYIHSHFKEYDANRPGKLTKETDIEMYELCSPASIPHMFNTVNKNPELLCFTQHQILDFIEQNEDQPRKGGYGTFFLYNSGLNIFAANIRFDDKDSQLEAFIYNFGTIGAFGVSEKDNNIRIVVPVLI